MGGVGDGHWHRTSQEKLGVAAAYVIAPVTRASGLIMEQTVAEKVVQPYLALGVTLLRA